MDGEYNDYDDDPIDYDDDWDDFYDEYEECDVVDSLNMKAFDNKNTTAVTVIIEAKDSGGKVEYHEFLNHGCYGFFGGLTRYTKSYEPLNMYVALRRKRNDDTFMNTFHEWMMDPKVSPWRSLIPKEGLQYELYPKSVQPYVKIPMSRETPAQLLVSFLMELRIGADMPDSAKMFVELLNAGWDQYLAFYTSLYLGLDNKGEVTDLYGKDWHSFSAATMNELDWIKKGTPKYNSKNTFGNNYGPIQAMWYKGTKADGRSDFYNLVAEPRLYSGLFSKKFKEDVNKTLLMPMTKMPTFKEVLERKDLIAEKVA